MALKEIYEEMGNEELLRAFENLKVYREEAKFIIVEEIRKRKLVSDEGIEEKLTLIKKYEEENQNEGNKKVNIIRKYEDEKEELGRYSKRMISATLVGISAFLLYVVLQISSGILTINWLDTEGKIFNKTVRQEEVTRTTGKGLSRKTRKEIVIHYHFKYKYLVNNIEYTNDQMSAGKLEEPYHYKENFEKYNEGQKITIYYNPKKPNQSFLIKYPYEKIIINTILITIFIYFFCVYIKKKSEKYNISIKFLSGEFIIYCVMWFFLM